MKNWLGIIAVLAWAPSAWAQTAKVSPTPVASPTPKPLAAFRSMSALKSIPVEPLQVIHNGFLVDDFSASSLATFPLGWNPKGMNGEPFYRVTKDPKDGFYLKVDAVKDGTSIWRRVEWDINQYPILEWRWRARVLPTDADEKRSSRNDSVLGVYVLFPVRLFFPDTLKYVWSTSLPVGTTVVNGAGHNKIFVVNSGSDHLGEWVTVRRNLVDDFKQRFDFNPPNPLAIGLITDADATASLASGDYHYLKVLKPEISSPVQ